MGAAMIVSTIKIEQKGGVPVDSDADSSQCDVQPVVWTYWASLSSPSSSRKWDFIYENEKYIISRMLQIIKSVI